LFITRRIDNKTTIMKCMAMVVKLPIKGNPKKLKITGKSINEAGDS